MEGRLKRLHHKCHYMGVRENDVIFSRFADRYLDGLTEAELDHFEELIAESDWDLFNWITGKTMVPAKYDTPVMLKLQECQEIE